MLAFSGVCQAQTVQVEEKEQSVNGLFRQGQQLTVQLDQKFVEKYWKDYLSKQPGKVKLRKGILSLEGVVLDTISSKPLTIFSVVGSHATGSYVWWSLDTEAGSISKNSEPEVYAAAEGFLKSFGAKLYKKDIFRQINQAEDVLQKTKAEQERVVKQANDIQASIEKNKKRKLELEAELVRNAEELMQLEADVENNAKQQQASQQQVLEMEKAVETVRAKLRAVK
ncbi:DNA repair ATPase [Pontibacter sp. SGAir0037]|nr:DNA repair ATPase [Pontibacter sp. SGAir0037]